VRLLPLATRRLEDVELEQVRRNHADAIGELQRLAVDTTPQLLTDVELADGVATLIAHRLGHAPRWVRESCPRGAATPGVVTEIRDGIDRTKFICVQADGFGATIAVDIEVR
jgi:hypothetical protein